MQTLLPRNLLQKFKYFNVLRANSRHTEKKSFANTSETTEVAIGMNGPLTVELSGKEAGNIMPKAKSKFKRCLLTMFTFCVFVDTGVLQAFSCR